MKRRAFFQTAGIAALGVSYLAWEGFTHEGNIPNELSAITGDGHFISIKKTDILDLKKSLAGVLLLADDDQYNIARLVRNRVINKNPALIAQCASDQDVQTAVNFAREHSLLVAVKCGGHSVSGKGTCDDGLMIDLSPLRGSRIDVHNKRIFMKGGSWLGELDSATLPHGLGTTAGTVSHTGIGGLSLGGGFGRLGRKFGLTLDNIKSVEIVTADGKLQYASEKENSDLFWAIRGGGGNFGIVTTFEFELHSMEREVIGGRITYPFSEAKQILKFYGEHSMNCSRDLYYDPVVFAPPGGFGSTVYIDVCYSGPKKDADAILRPLYQAGTAKDEIRPIDYVELQKSGDDDDPRGRSQYLKGGFTVNVSDELIDTLVDNLVAHPERGSMAFFQHSGGAINDVSSNATAFPHRYASNNLVTGSFWIEGVDTAPHIKWSRSYWKKVEQFTDGFYSNDEFTENQEQVNRNYLGNYERLVRIKNQYDPNNLFRLNSNIQPSV